MPIIAVQVQTLKTPKMMQDNLRLTLHKAGLPEYSWKEQRAGFEVWHAEDNEGETKIIWHTFGAGDEREEAAQIEMRAGLEKCAAVLMENYWVQLYVPNRRKMRYGRTHLRVILRLSWLK
jgi:hypothetical protein